MKSLKEFIADEVITTNRELSLGEAEFILTVLNSVQNDTSKYEVLDNKLKHVITETVGLETIEYIDGRMYKVTKVYPSGNKRYEHWVNENEDLHRIGAPATIVWYENGNKKFEGWDINGLRHREQSGEGSGPAETKWYPSGKKWYEAWFINGIRKRENGLSSLTIWDENGAVIGNDDNFRGINNVTINDATVRRL